MEPTSKRQLERMATSGRHLEAEEEVVRNKEVKAAKALARRKLLEEEQALQWQAFSRAKARFYRDSNLATAANHEKKRETLKQKHQDDRRAHEEELEAYAEREETTTMRRPVAFSTRAVDLRREEKLLVLKHRFLEAAAMRDLVTRQESEEVRECREARQRTLAEKISGRENLYLEKERISLKNLRSKMLLEQLKSQRETACAQARLQHMETDMAAAHAKQRKDLHQLGFVPNVSKAQFWNANRGSLLEKRVLGDHYSIPSLCALYGEDVDRESRLPAL